jgi:hypothetical protein
MRPSASWTTFTCQNIRVWLKAGVYGIPMPNCRGAKFAKPFSNCSGNLGASLRNELVNLWLVKKLCCFCTAPELRLHMISDISAKKQPTPEPKAFDQKTNTSFFLVELCIAFPQV